MFAPTIMCAIVCRGRRPRRPGRADIESAPTTVRGTPYHYRRGGFHIRPQSEKQRKHPRAHTVRPYILYTPIENLGPKGQSVGRRKSVKKNAALLHFLAFSLADLPSGVPRGRAPLGGVRCLATARLFRFLFGHKKEGLKSRMLL